MSAPWGQTALPQAQGGTADILRHRLGAKSGMWRASRGTLLPTPPTQGVLMITTPQYTVGFWDPPPEQV